MRVVAKDKAVLERLNRILKNEDEEFALAENRGSLTAIISKDGEFFVSDMFVDGAWDCSEFLYHDDNPSEKVVKDMVWNPDRNDYDTTYGTAHYTNLPHLAKTLGFGCEAWTSEPGCGFCEHWTVDHNGQFEYDKGEYSVEYPEGEDGKPDMDADPIEESEFGDFNDFYYPDDIWG
jgi:hypothetical protein